MLDEEAPAPAEGRRHGRGDDWLGKAIGQVCHAVLAGWDFGAGSGPDLSAAVDRALLGLEGFVFGSAKGAKLAKDAREVLSSFLESPLPMSASMTLWEKTAPLDASRFLIIASRRTAIFMTISVNLLSA